MESFSIPLYRDNDEEAEFRLHNEVDEFNKPVPHRMLLTGYDRQGSAASLVVNGSMPIVVHGNTNSPSDPIPHTLAIFDWHMAANRSGKRFREVAIEMVFHASGSRGDAEPAAKQGREDGFLMSHWNPQVIDLAPAQTTQYQRMAYTTETSKVSEIAVTAGVESFLSAELKHSFSKKDSGIQKNSALTIVGTQFVTFKSKSGANAVRWTFLENEVTKEGVPSFVRTAVMLKRRRNDNGQFLGTVKVEAKVSFVHSLEEKLWALTGHKPKDDAIVFDSTGSDRPGEYEKWRSCLDQVNLKGIARVTTADDCEKNGGEEALGGNGF